MTRIDAATRAEFLAAHGDWTLEGEAISKTFALRDFKESMAFVTQVALASEAADHHPDIDIRWNKVTVVLSTHSAGALTAKDIGLAVEFDSFYSS
jgi:4a-hydroxytetrahydrobiopterin dehydratase